MSLMRWEDSQFQNINHKLDVLTGLVRQLLTQEAKLAVDLTTLTAEVANNTSVTNSVVTLLGNLTAIIKAIPASTDPVTQAALDQLRTTLASNDTAIAGAVVANTPAAPPQAAKANR
jgi:hypothetical protein